MWCKWLTLFRLLKHFYSHMADDPPEISGVDRTDRARLILQMKKLSLIITEQLVSQIETVTLTPIWSVPSDSLWCLAWSFALGGTEWHVFCLALLFYWVPLRPVHWFHCPAEGEIKWLGPTSYRGARTFSYRAWNLPGKFRYHWDGGNSGNKVRINVKWKSIFLKQ